MEFLSNKPLLITDTILRDAHQSQAATRMTLEQMLPACEILDSIGYYSLECWGGATFDACMRFLNEDPWERLRTIRQHVKHTKLQMLFRGQNILGYKHYADDVVDAFCAKSIENGIDIIRIFDALNDVRNLEQAIKSTKKYGGQVEATLSYTISPIHNEAYFVKLAKELEGMGADAICIKDMANLLLPMEAYSLVKALKETVSVPIHLHTHNTSGTGDIFPIDMTVHRNPEYVLDIIKGSFKMDLRYLSFYSSDSDVIRVTGYLVKRSELEKLAGGEAVLQDTTALGLGAARNGHILERKVR